MISKEIFFLGIKEDLLNILIYIESNFKIQYIKAGLLCDIPSIEKTLKNKSNLGIVDHKDWNFNEKFLILNQDTELMIRKIEQRRGGVKYAIDQLKNQNSIVVSLGGYNQSENAIIASKITALYDTDFINKIYKELSKIIKKNSKKTGRFYISKGALDMSTKGVRLTEDSRSTRNFDIVVSN